MRSVSLFKVVQNNYIVQVINKHLLLKNVEGRQTDISAFLAHAMGGTPLKAKTKQMQAYTIQHNPNFGLRSHQHLSFGFWKTTQPVAAFPMIFTTSKQLLGVTRLALGTRATAWDCVETPPSIGILTACKTWGTDAEPQQKTCAQG